MTTVRNLMQVRLMIFMLIASVFWAVLNQLWDMLPNYIVDWVDSSTVAGFLPDFFLSRDTSRGPQLAQEWLINFNPFLIILLVAPMSWLCKPLYAAAHRHILGLRNYQSGNLSGRLQHVDIFMPGGHWLIFHRRNALFSQND